MRRLPADMPALPLDRSLVAWWTLDALAGVAMWVAIFWLVGWL